MRDLENIENVPKGNTSANHFLNRHRYSENIMAVKSLNSFVFYLSTFPFTTNYFIGRISVFSILLLKKIIRCLWKKCANFQTRTALTLKTSITKMVKDLMFEELQLIDIAIDLEDLEIVKHYFEFECKDVSTLKTDTGYTPLHIGVSLGSIEICKMLLQKGVNVNAINNDGFMPLHLVYDDNKVEIARILIQNGANVGAQIGTESWTLLHYAAIDNLPEITKVLLENGGEINAASSSGSTPLHMSIAKGNIEVSKILIQNGANLNALTNNGFNQQRKTPIEIALSNKKLRSMKLMMFH